MRPAIKWPTGTFRARATSRDEARSGGEAVSSLSVPGVVPGDEGEWWERNNIAPQQSKPPLGFSRRHPHGKKEGTCPGPILGPCPPAPSHTRPADSRPGGQIERSPTDGNVPLGARRSKQQRLHLLGGTAFSTRPADFARRGELIAKCQTDGNVPAQWSALAAGETLEARFTRAAAGA